MIPSKNILTALKGIGGEFEVVRTLAAFGVAAYIIGAHAFVAYDVMWMKRPFDLTVYCLTFPTGLGAVLAAVAGAASWKDKGVASAKITEQTGAVPAPPKDGPPVPMGDAPPVSKV